MSARRVLVGVALLLALLLAALLGGLVGVEIGRPDCPTEDSCAYVHGTWEETTP